MSHKSWLNFASLQHIPGLGHAVTTRQGGCSDGAHSSLNLGYHVGDDAAHVSQNRRLLAEALGCQAENLVAAQQVHGARCRVVEASWRGRGALGWEDALPGTDALIVRSEQVPVLILVADCAPLLLVNAERHVLAVVHAGWRGALAGVAGAAVEAMRREFGSRPDEIQAGIGPCLCPDCFEVGPEVAAEAMQQTRRAVLPAAPEQGWPKPHLDLRALLNHDLQRADVLSAHIEALPHCPRCMNEIFFSHRGQNGHAGRFGLVAWWQ